MKIQDLKPNPKNPRQITDKKLEMLRKSLNEFGDLSGIVFNKTTGKLVGGHQRIKVIPSDAVIDGDFITWEGQRMAYREVEWDETKEKAANIAANKHGGEWDLPNLNEWLSDLKADNFDMELTGFDAEELADIVKEPKEGLCDEDEVPEEVPAKTKLGEIYQLGAHRLMCGDSTDKTQVERLMKGENADMVFMDPPYNVAENSKNHAADKSKSMNDLKNAEWDSGFKIEPALDRIRDSVSDQCTIYIWTSQWLVQNIWNHLNQWCDYTSYCVWAKPNPMPSLSKRHWTWATELCVYGSIGTKRIVNFPEQGHALNWWSDVKKSDGSHPTQKPIEICERPILFSSNSGQLVLDLFLGSGSTLIACEKTNRKCYGMEIDPKYCDVIIARWEKFTGKKAELIESI